VAKFLLGSVQKSPFNDGESPDTIITMPTRGAYAKGIAKRDEILAIALEVFARYGYRRTSLRHIADGADLTPAGLLHYFSSKDDLFTEILRERDESDDISGTTDDALDSYVNNIRRNATVPGLIRLSATLTVEAADRGHPAHEFVVRRHEHVVSAISYAVRQAQASGSLPRHMAADTIARFIVALSNGLQTQWLLDDDVDVAQQIKEFVGLLMSLPVDSQTEPATLLKSTAS